MKTRFSAFFGLALMVIGLFSAGCASDEAIEANQKLPGQGRYSNMPQNLPQGWEGQGMLGGMAGYQ